ncbi:sugar fermentation stimulation protein A [Microvirga flocculans]|uniref:Sugar fermentation stimulation protein homolog n=1 Tax=Microvirga flocculans TaxID=217168 RepID=A0A7W6N769_9HYPH|nr:DNA/RNA nuclease SfsA [Microvirga flocculans]MBB4039808.1 sugar fermentation stimulation protein A [Microvirga flocculans]
MRFQETLLGGRLIERYKRFLADIELDTGEVVTAHCANPGAMLGLKEPGSRVLLSRATNPSRKLRYNWEFVEVAAGGGPLQLVGINTSRPNLLVAEALREGRLAPFAAYDRVRPEVKYGKSSRVDFLLEKDGERPCYLEVKNCHLMREAGFAEFPDCVAARSAKHLYELADMVAQGARAALVYVIQMDAERFDVARDIDPAYDRAFRHALASGVESYAYDCRITPQDVTIDRPVPIVTPR